MARMSRVPAGDRGIYDALSARFRESEADWLATERQSGVRDEAARAAGRGPTVWERDRLVAFLGLAPARPRRRPGKAEYVALLRRIVEGVDWSVDELTGLLEREAA